MNKMSSNVKNIKQENLSSINFAIINRVAFEMAFTLKITISPSFCLTPKVTYCQLG